jgi:hypothetical protein
MEPDDCERGRGRHGKVLDRFRDTNVPERSQTSA